MTSQIYSSCSYCRAWTIHPDQPRDSREPHVHSPRDADSDHQEWMVTRNETDLHPSSHNTNPPYPLGQSSAREEAFHYRGSLLGDIHSKGQKEEVSPFRPSSMASTDKSRPQFIGTTTSAPQVQKAVGFLILLLLGISWQKLNHVEREFYCRPDSD